MTYKRPACSLIRFLNITKASVFWLKVCYVLVCFFRHLSLSGGYCIMLVRFDKTHYRYWASLLLYKVMIASSNCMNENFAHVTMQIVF